MELHQTDDFTRQMESCHQTWLETARAYVETKVPLERLLWEGAMVLNQAVVSFHENRFDSIEAAVECLMRRRIIGYLVSDHCIHPIPFEILDLIKFLKSRLSQFVLEEGYEPTIKEYSNWLKLQSQHEVVQAFQKKRERMAEDDEIRELTKLVDGLLPEDEKIMRYCTAKP